MSDKLCSAHCLDRAAVEYSACGTASVEVYEVYMKYVIEVFSFSRLDESISQQMQYALEARCRLGWWIHKGMPIGKMNGQVAFVVV